MSIKIQQDIMRIYTALFPFLLFILSFDNLEASMFGYCNQKNISKTVLKTRTLGQYNMPFVDISFSNGLQDQENQKINLNIIATSTFSIDPTFGCEFAINRKPIMQIAGNNTPYAHSRDIEAELINGTSSTVAQMNLGAEESMVGARLFLQIPFYRFWKNDLFLDWFLSIRTTLTRLSRKLQMTLSSNDKDSLIPLYAFFNKQTAYGKIDNQTKIDVGLENITVTLDGIYYSPKQKFQIYYFSGIEIPTQSTYTSEYLFSPTIGNNGTIGIVLGGDFRGFFKTTDSYQLGLFFELEDHCMLYKTSARTFDLYNTAAIEGTSSVSNKNKPWSRYLPAVSEKLILENQTISAASTLPVRIHPCNVLDLSLGILFEQYLNKNKEKCLISVGYNLWASQAEYAELQDRVYAVQYQKFYETGISGTLPHTTANNSTIAKRFANDPTQKNLTFNDLDMGSVASDGGYSQSAFFRVSVINKNVYQILFGGWYEFGKSLIIPSRLGGWIGGGFEF